MRYFMTQRPAQPGAMPQEGLVRIRPGNKPDWISKHVWNVLEYNRELTRKEVRDYELIPDYPPEEYKGYIIRFLPYTWEWAIIDLESEHDALAYCKTIEEAREMIDKRPKRR